MKLSMQPVLAVMLLLLLAGAARAAGPTKDECALAGIKSPQELVSFVKSLQKAVKKDDLAAVAAMVSYPIQVDRNGHSQSIENSAAFVKNYYAIMTKEVRASVVETKTDDIIVNRKGFDVGSLHAQVDGDKLAVTAVNE
ncbi:MAG: hypothetical protein P4L43_07455 [Syntrophobacteraceae bacterium]|nr:hypothetical protein [Syntrophobacteraceae bacterium]